ncbi:KilA-N domain-containing protein [Sphingopyxis sp. RIFCSPHIGHO2_12_FULL_65_19]|uniref:KilA-N domain-containing protein n=1 Tax=Sphingopyxis sp. RIFCSPHIGHO2_12_FULL_65_19 TaxID=1802172 RepID=UPI0008B36398|nr:KilA-N domain-containing protein [Sphingopyxis sp. RIFCSPHIGHO2_12_FULL_65_19]OHD05587.1 MAG: hypothetical protein A3E77_14940 [Sphingopyxis sp. RIFCSPHIGHO2_12_FULL_65_19]
MTTPDNRRDIVIRGKAIREDGAGNILLDDIWTLAQAKQTKAPKFWQMGQAAKALINALNFKVRNSNLNGDGVCEPIYAKRGQGQKGTYAHPILAAAYAGYLDPNLEIEVREVWLRYRAGDSTLADEILQRASAEANKWAGLRALSRSQRSGYTDVLKAHGVTGKEGYMACTEAVYVHLLGGKSWELRNALGLPKGANLRDAVGIDNLSWLMAAEALAADRIEDEGCTGNDECADASATAARAIKKAIEDDRRSRKRRAA